MAAVTLGLTVSGCAEPTVPLGRLVQEAVELGPGRGSDGYLPPEPAQARTVALTVAALAAGGQPEEPPDGYVFQPVSEGDRELVALREVTDGGGTSGNGLYVVSPGAGSGLVVQVPHPVADIGTESLGADLAAVAAADVLMVATAHRDAGGGDGDVANVPGSVFDAVSGTVVGPDSLVLQVHGFASEDHPDSYGDVVLSSTVPEAGPLVEGLAGRLRDAGFEVCVYDGERCSGLAGTRNVQAAAARLAGAEFAHVEVSDRVRQDAGLTRALVEALADGARGGAGSTRVAG